jgi:hypothetical protein
MGFPPVMVWVQGTQMRVLSQGNREKRRKKAVFPEDIRSISGILNATVLHNCLFLPV